MSKNKENNNDIHYEADENEVDSLGRSKKERELRQKLKECQKEKQEYLAGWQRTKADLVNKGRAHEEERRETRKRASETVITDVVDVLESFEMAFANKEAWEKVDSRWREGVEHIHNQLLGVLRSHGLEEIDPEGAEFNTDEHEAIESVETDDESKDGIIASVARKGYRVGGNIIQPARVRVYEYRN
ncbi:MAG: nucleotide exchange factor GrpE [Candidatus Paceibacterota bacterium]